MTTSVATVTVLSVIAGDVKFCPSCGTEALPSATFCGACGSRLRPAPDSLLPAARRSNAGFPQLGWVAAALLAVILILFVVLRESGDEAPDAALTSAAESQPIDGDLDLVDDPAVRANLKASINASQTEVTVVNNNDFAVTLGYEISCRDFDELIIDTFEKTVSISANSKTTVRQVATHFQSNVAGCRWDVISVKRTS